MCLLIFFFQLHYPLDTLDLIFQCKNEAPEYAHSLVPNQISATPRGVVRSAVHSNPHLTNTTLECHHQCSHHALGHVTRAVSRIVIMIAVRTCRTYWRLQRQTLVLRSPPLPVSHAQDHAISCVIRNVAHNAVHRSPWKIRVTPRAQLTARRAVILPVVHLGNPLLIGMIHCMMDGLLINPSRKVKTNAFPYFDYR